MKIICKPRQMGKTTELIKIAAQNLSTIICRSDSDARKISAQAHKMNIIILTPITIDDFLKGRFHADRIKNFCIDNPELILKELAQGVEISAISLDMGDYKVTNAVEICTNEKDEVLWIKNFPYNHAGGAGEEFIEDWKHCMTISSEITFGKLGGCLVERKVKLLVDRTPKNKFQEIAKEAYEETHITAPPDVPTWNQLHQVERDYLVKFAETVLKMDKS